MPTCLSWVQAPSGGWSTPRKSNPGPLTILTVNASDPRGFGRVIRDAQGSIQAVVEEAAATAKQLSIHELNVGAYCFSANWLWDALNKIKVSKKGEYYLTDTVALAVQAGSGSAGSRQR